MRSTKKKGMAISLAIAMTLGVSPVPVFAEGDGICSHHPSHTADCGYTEPVAGAACGFEHDADCVTLGGTEECRHIVHDEDCGYVEGEEGTPCGFICEECAGISGEETQSGKDGAEAEGNGNTADENPADEIVEISETVQIDVSDEDFPYDGDELLAGYVQKILYKDIPGNDIPEMFSNYGESALEGTDLKIYNALKAEIKKVAAGTRQDTEFVIQGSELGIASWESAENQAADEGLQKFKENIDFSKILSYLLADCPYDFYWFDKTEGYGCQYAVSVSISGGKTASISKVTFRFSVSADYSFTAEPGTYQTDSANITLAAQTPGKAQAIVSKYAGKSDYEKLKGYKDEICSLVDYNTSAAETKDTPYGNPWQLVHVFDGNAGTKVVCEGYAKAFQYLCDLGGFEECYTVSGNMSGGTGAGRHMWNIVRLGGKSYLVDVTNSDKGAAGEKGELFLAGTSGSVNSGYSFAAGGKTIQFTYDGDTISDYGNGILTLASTNYDPDTTAPDAGITITKQPEGYTKTYGDAMTALTVEVSLLDASKVITYQWYKDGSAISGAVNNRYTPEKDAGAHTYYCKLTCDGKSVNSSAVAVTVNKASLTPSISGTAPTKTYDGTTAIPADHGLTITLAGIKDKDTVNATAGAFAYNTPDAGEDKTITATGITISGASAGNYVLSQTTATLAGGKITKKEISGEAPLTVVKPVAVNKAQLDIPVDLTSVLAGYPGAALKDIAADVSDANQIIVPNTVRYTGNTVRFDVNSIPTAGLTATITVEAESSNYTGIAVIITVVTTDKTPVAITGVSVPDKTYDGQPVSYSGTPTARNGSAAVSVSGYAYTWKKGDAILGGAPKDAGNYTLTVAVADNDNAYAGEAVIPFTIEKRRLAWNAEGLTASKPAGREGNVKVYGTLLLDGVLNDEVRLMTTEYETEDFAGQTAPGEYTVPVVGKGQGWIFAPADPANYILPEGSPQITATINEVTVTEGGSMPPELAAVPENNGAELKLEVERGISAVPLELAKFQSPGEIVVELKQEISRYVPSIKPEENTEVYDVTLMVKGPASNTWAPATEGNFPQSGKITVTLPYPRGTNRSGYNFTAIHMFTANAFGRQAGEMETCAVEKTSSGLRLAVTGLSPIIIGWTEITPVTPEQGGQGGGSGSGGGSGKYFTISSGAGIGGTITTDNGSSVRRGEKKTYYITPDEGYEIADVLVDGVSVGAVGKYTFEDVQKRHSIEAKFRKIGGAAEPLEAAEPGAANSYSDVNAGEWYAGAVDYVSGHGIMSGTGAGRFTPNGITTRGMIAVILYRLAGSPAVSGGSPFADVAADAYYADAVTWAAENGVVSGYGASAFGPNDPVTREQLASILWRQSGSPAANGSLDGFADKANVSGYAADAAVWAVEQGIISGRPDGSLDPAGKATRAETASILMRFLEKSPYQAG